MATAEFAVALPAVVVVLALVIGVAQLLLVHHRTWQAASVAARVAARGQNDTEVRAAVSATGLPGSVGVSRAGGWITVDVTTPAPIALRWAVSDVTAHAVAAQERGDAEGGADVSAAGASSGSRPSP